MGSSAVPWGEQQTSSSPATAAVMVHSKLTSEAGMASASAAAQQAKIKLQKKHQQELLAAALTPPQQRTQSQIESLCDFLSTVHLWRNVQPTALKSLAHAMSGQLHAAGEAIYRQGEAARHLFVVLSGEVVMYEHDTQHSLQDAQDSSAVSADSTATPGAHGTANSSGRGSGQGSRLGSSSGLRTQQSPSPHRTASPSTHKPGSPRRPGSTAGGRSSASTPSSSAAAARSPRAVDGSGRQHSEVRRVRPREAFGEDEVTAGGHREQTAVSVAATRSTFASSGIASSSPGSKAAGAAATSSSSGTAGGAQQQTGALSASAAAAAPDSSSAAPAAPAMLASGAAATAASDPRSQCVVLVLSAEDYGAALEGRLTSLLEEKVTVLSGLPAMKGLNMHYLRTLAHCFHQVIFEPREVVVRQGDVSDCMYVLKSGQVCILIDPSLTLAETTAADDSSGDGSRKGPGHGSSSGGGGGGGGGGEAPLSNEVDTKKLVQVCLLGGGAIIGDMSVRESAGGPPRRSATVVALTELVTYKVPLREFVRRMPADVLEGMRQVANQKLEMNGSKAQGRALANGRDGHVLLGGLTLPEGVLHGKGLRALMDAQQQVAPVGGLIQALELCVASDSSSTCKGKTGGAGSSPQQHPSKKWFVSGSKAAQEVDGFVDSLSRNGFLAAPPTEFLALMADWRSTRTNNSSQQQQVPPGWVFPLPVPSKSPTRATAAALAASNSHLHPAVGTLAPLAHATSCGAGPWDDPAVTTHTVYASRPQTPQHAASGSVQQTSSSMTAAGPAQELGSMATCVGARAQMAAEGGAAGAADTTGLSGLASHPLMSSPTSLLAALSLDQYAQPSPLASPCSSRHGSRPATPAGTSSGSKSLNGAAVVKEAAQHLLGGGLLSPKATCRAAGGMGGRGQLLRGPLGQQGLPACVDAGGKAATAGQGAFAAVQAGAYITPFAVGPGSSKEPSIEEAIIKAAVLFRPGSPITIGRCGSLQSPTQGSSRVAAAANHAGTPVLPPSLVLEGLAPNVHAAVVTNRTGKQELTFHGAAGPAVAIQMTR